MIRCALFIVATTLCVSATERKWEFIQPRPVNTSPAQQADSGAFPAWYHMPAKQQHAPAYNAFDRRDGAAFERPQQPVDNAYRGFTSFVRTPASAPSSPYVSESPSPRRGFPQPAQPDGAPLDVGDSGGGSSIRNPNSAWQHYPFAITSDPNMSAVEKYHRLLLKKSSGTYKTRTTTLEPFRFTTIQKRLPVVIDPDTKTVPIRLRPLPAIRPPLGIPRPGGTFTTPRPKPVRPIVNKVRERLRLRKILPEQTPAPEVPPPEVVDTGDVERFTTPPSFPVEKSSGGWHKLNWTRKTSATSSTSTSTTTTTTTTTSTTTPTIGSPEAPTLPPRFICNKKDSSDEEHDHGISGGRSKTKRPVIGPFRPVSRTRATWATLPPRRIVPNTTPLPASLRWTFFDLFRPNAELFNAIRDVVNKFKASLDESGLDQDVRHMSRQLQNTWHQLRAGNPRGSMNEQLSHMFSRNSQQDAPRRP